MAKREYVKEDLTVFWDSDLCTHCRSCHDNLPQVFDPEKRPWVNMNGATKEEIHKQVDQCPSGALLAVKEF